MPKPIIIIAILAILLGLAVVFFIGAENGPEDQKTGSMKSKENQTGQSRQGVSVLNKWDVPEDLKEISALSYIDNQRFACINDEVGKIFIYNTETKKIEKEVPFAGPGDYEGLALNGETAYALRADGLIFEIINYNSAKPVVKQYQTHLTQKQDTEGLAFDKANNRLLICIKGKEPESDEYKGVYAFDLATKKMNPEPVFKIDLQNEVFGGSKSGKKKKKDSPMNPSEIAIHPVNGNLYITEGSKPKLLIMDKAGNIISLINLEGKEFSQPEGIAFSPDGKLYISNEGTREAGNILEVEAD